MEVADHAARGISKPDEVLILRSWRWRRYSVVSTVAAFVGTVALSGYLFEVDGSASGALRTLAGIAGGVVLCVGLVLSVVVFAWMWCRPSIRVDAKGVSVYNWRRVRCALSDIVDVTWVEPQRLSIRSDRRVPALVLGDRVLRRMNFAASVSQDEADRLLLAGHGDLSDARTLMSVVSGERHLRSRGRRPVPVRRLVIGIGVIALAAIWAAIWAGIAWSQFHQVRVDATVTGWSCHQGADDAGVTCQVILDYTAPDGTPGTVTFNGVNAFRLHGPEGHQTMFIYFSDPSSETAINPQDNPPYWVSALMVAFSIPVLIGGFVYIWRGFRPNVVRRISSRGS